MTQAPPPTSDPLPSPSDDPLASLHKMSRTAGLGSTDYVAVNPTAVVALLLGLASALAVLGTILLIIPAVTIVVAILAFRQITHSAGTQTGRGLAVLGLLLALGCFGFIGGREVLQARRTQEQTNDILRLVEQFSTQITQGHYDAAYDDFSQRFRDRVKKEEFVGLWPRLEASAYYGKISGIKSNGIIEVRSDPDTGQTFAMGVLLMDLPTGREDRRQTQFRLDEQGRWSIDEIEGFFQPQTPQRGGR